MGRRYRRMCTPMKSREHWLVAGERLASENGGRAVTIAALCRALGLSKGSFYQHFRNLADYTACLDARLQAGGRAAPRARSGDRKTPWFELALSILGSDGYAGITLDALNQRMGVTKGAFYYLFKSRQAFVRELLAHWREQTLGEMIGIMRRRGEGMETVDAILDFSRQLVNRRAIDVQIRAWALTDPDVARYQAELDQVQLDASRTIIRQLLGGDGALAEAAATLAYLSFIGAQQIVPAMPESAWADQLKVFLPFITRR